MVNAVQLCRSLAQDGWETAAEASLRDLIDQFLRELDGIESSIFIRGTSLGLHFDGLPPYTHYLKRVKNRVSLHFKNSDSAAAECIIRCTMDCIIKISRSKHAVAEADPVTEQLFQHVLGCLNASIRHFRAYL